MTVSSDPAELLKLLPNLSKYEITECSFSVAHSGRSRGVPSPSDIRTDLNGSATFSEDAAAALKADFDWQPVSRDDLPTSVLSDAPAGALMTSAGFNESFDSNARYVKAYAVTSADAPCVKIYFVATDLDHSIE